MITLSPRRAGAATAALVAAAALAVPATAPAVTGPTVTTLPVDTTLLTDSYVLLSGVVNPQGAPVVYFFQWGPTTAYGHTTPVTSASNGKADVPVDVSLDDSDGIKPNTTYHFRLVAEVKGSSNDALYAGDYDGADQAFKTTRSDGLSAVSNTAKVVGGAANVKVKGVGVPGDDATGSISLAIPVSGAAKVSKATAKFTVAVGKTKTVKVKLNKRQRKALKKHHNRLKVKATVKTSGVKKATTFSLTLVG